MTPDSETKYAVVLYNEKCSSLRQNFKWIVKDCNTPIEWYLGSSQIFFPIYCKNKAQKIKSIVRQNSLQNIKNLINNAI